MFSYTFKAMARYQEKDKLSISIFNTYADSQEEAYKDIKANADKVCCDYRNLRLVKVETITVYESMSSIVKETPIVIWEESKQVKYKKRLNAGYKKC
jgi:hypothetical protein